jgi:hypothetical protein
MLVSETLKVESQTLQAPKIPFYPTRLKLTVMAQSLFTIIFLINLSKYGYHVFNWLLPGILFIGLVGMKTTAPRVPLWQVFSAALAVFIVASLSDLLFINISPIFFLLGNILNPIICVHGFGRYWVNNEYLPEVNNWW